MLSPPPTKPPRGVKQGKETSGLLMSVIRTLSASETNEQREKERAKLEKEYKKSDARLEELVAAHAADITMVMQKFESVGSALRTCAAHGSGANARLEACRGLLRLRRDDLRRLWLDARTHHHALLMLTDMSQVVAGERAAVSAINAGRVVRAAGELRTALSLANGPRLAAVPALDTTRTHLATLRDRLVTLADRTLCAAVYAIEDGPPPAEDPMALLTSLLEDGATNNASEGEAAEELLWEAEAEADANVDMTVGNERSFRAIAASMLEALCRVDELGTYTEKFKVQIQSELLNVIAEVTRRQPALPISASNNIRGDDLDFDDTEEGRAVSRLMWALREQFRACAHRQRLLLPLWRAALCRRTQPQTISPSSPTLYTEQHYWSGVQQVVQLLLTDYLRIEGASGPSGGTPTSAAQSIPLTEYFARKRRPGPRAKLYRVPHATPATPVSSGTRALPLLVRPHPALLHAALPALVALLGDVEGATGGATCSLRGFLQNHVRWAEAERLAVASRAHVHRALNNPSAWRETAPPPPPPGAASGPGTYKHRHTLVYSCCITAWEGVRRACLSSRRASAALCGGATASAGGALGGAAEFAALARTQLATLAPPPHRPHSRAARWLADEDIVRFLQALPNWQAATAPASARPPPEELRAAYAREAEILGGSLADGALRRTEIIPDRAPLAALAIFMESMDWLSACVSSIPLLLREADDDGDTPGDAFLADVSAAAYMFEELCHKCLLFLHLELRIQCFYYLGQDEEEVAENNEIGGASRLANALLAFHEHAAPLVGVLRLRYITEGLGEMMSAGVVWRTGRAGAAGEEGAAEAQLDTLRHCLGALRGGGGEASAGEGLERAARYVRLLWSAPEAVVRAARDRPPPFTDLELLNAVKVIAARRRLPHADTQRLLQRLEAALGDTGVTV